MNLEKYECDGQISIFDMSWGAEMKRQQAKTRNAGKPRKAPVWHELFIGGGANAENRGFNILGNKK